jgi:hypothetical protein
LGDSPWATALGGTHLLDTLGGPDLGDPPWG